MLRKRTHKLLSIACIIALSIAIPSSDETLTKADGIHRSIKYEYAISAYEKGLISEAVGIFETIASPEGIEFYYVNYGLALQRLGDSLGAIEALSESIRLNEVNATAYLTRGIAKMSVGRNSDGCEDIFTSAQLGESISKQWLQNNTIGSCSELEDRPYLPASASKA